jgi:hypothetical protein
VFASENGGGEGGKKKKKKKKTIEEEVYLLTRGMTMKQKNECATMKTLNESANNYLNLISDIQCMPASLGVCMPF